MNVISIRNPLATLVIGALLLAGTSALADEPKVPHTAEEHLALAKEYQDKAASYRKEAAHHRSMAEAYKKDHPPAKGGQPNPWVVKMEKHCQTIAKNADQLATDAEKAAEYHTLRAKELQGQ